MTTLKAIKTNNGATLNKNGEAVTLKTGYQMSVRDLLVIPVYAMRKKLLVDLLGQLNRGEYLGVWIDSGKAYIDISRRIATKGKAIEMGKATNQLSVFNWAKKDLVWC